MAKLAKEVWIQMLMNDMYPNTSFLARSVDMSEFVDHNKINLAEAGVNPEVYIDEKGDIATASRTDIPLELALHTFDSQNTLVKNIEQKESSYNKMESVVANHRSAISAKEAVFAAHNWTPTENTDLTPVLIATGEVSAATGYKKLTFEDVLTLDAKFRALDVNMDNAVLVLHPFHMADLMSENMKMYKEMLTSKKIFSFEVFTFSKTPTFNGTTGEKKAMGAVVAATDAICSFCYIHTEVMRAGGTVDMFTTEKDPTVRGDIVGFQHRFTALSIRNKYCGAVYSTKP